VRYNFPMRIAMFVVVALAGCASGGKPDNNGDVDASTGTDGVTTNPDAGCGGTNQLPCEGVYVAKNGNDTASGTKGAPLRTIAMGIAKAGATSQKAVFVRAGSYNEQIVMSPGVTVYGGFDETWTRSPSVVTEIVGASPVVKFEAITVATAIDTFTIKADDATVLGDSSYAVLAVNSQLVELRDVTIDAGIGAAGTDGTNGVNGANGTAGLAGNPGVERSSGLLCDSNPVPLGGQPGTSACGRTGGVGGQPGVGGSGGNAGGTAISGVTPGGAGAPGESQNGSVGNNGFNGFNGGGGAGGLAAGTFNGTRYEPSNGTNGGDGGVGNGGGGGGGGGGGTTDCDSTGSSGGGGGGGGCAGTGGTGGGGGGGSFGVIAVDSSVVIRSSTVTANRGGAGGRGGTAGSGGIGGAGGAGGPYGGSAEQDDGGFGAAGGRGGNGGNGGPGGGGGGGPSAAVVCVGAASINVPQTMLVAGTGGAGGTSPANAGATGTSTNAIGCQFF